MRVQNVVIPARDFQETVRFYRDSLGLPVAFQTDAYCFLEAGAIHVAIHPVIETSEFWPTGNGIYLDIVVEDFARVRERLIECGVSIVREWQDETIPFLLVSDPNGNLLEVYAYTPAPKSE